MGDVLAELEVALRSNKENATNQEIAVLLTCKAKAIRDFTIGAFSASGVVWAVAATRKLSFGHRLSYSGEVCCAGCNRRSFRLPEETSRTDIQNSLTKRQARSNRRAHRRSHRSQNQ